MKRIIGFTVVSLILAALLGCQPEQKKQTTGVSRKDRLVGYENLGLKDELAKCRAEIENQKKLLADCQANYQSQCEKNCQEQYKTQYDRQAQLTEEKYKQDFENRCDEKFKQEKQQYEDNINWLLNDLPADLLKQVDDLTKENEELKQKLEQLQGVSAAAVAEPNK
jgi:flagellar biosynthesis GTPase FlhF